MNSRLKNILFGSIFICFGIGIGIGIGAGIWSDDGDPIDQGPDNPVDNGPFVEFYNEKLGNITGIIDHRTAVHDGVVKFLGEAKINISLVNFVTFRDSLRRKTKTIHKSSRKGVANGIQCNDIWLSMP